MRTPHTLRDRAQANVAPRAVGFALFVVIALALLASVRSGPLATAEGHPGGPAHLAQVGPPPEPVLGGVGIPPAGPVDAPTDPADGRSRSGYRAHRRPDHPDPDQLPSVEPAPEPETDTPAPEDGTVEPPTAEPPSDTPPVEEDTDPPVEPPPPVETPTDPNTRPPPIGGRQRHG